MGDLSLQIADLQEGREITSSGDCNSWGETYALAGEEKHEEILSMTRKSAVRKRPAVHAAPRIDVVLPDTPTLTSGGFTALLESATQPILAVTYWFDPAPQPKPYPVTVRFTGRRVDVKGRMQ